MEKNFMACGLLEYDANGNKMVVVAGGQAIDFDNYDVLVLDEIEVWKVDSSDDKFTQFGKLPTPLFSSGFVTDADGKSLLIAGGISTYDDFAVQSAIYSLTCNDQACQAEKLPQELELARANPVAMLLPNEATDCTKP